MLTADKRVDDTTVLGVANADVPMTDDTGDVSLKRPLLPVE